MKHDFQRVRRGLIWLVLSVFVVTCSSDRLASPERLAPASLLTGPNLLLDGGFENGGADWQNSAATGRSVDGTQFHAGAFAQLILASAAGENVVYQDVAVTAGRSYATDAWVFTQDLNDAGGVVELLWLDGPGLPEVPPAADLLGTQVVGTLNGTEDWTLVSGTFDAPAGAVVARVQLRVALEGDDAGAAWFDDGSVTEVIPPDVTPPTVILTAPAAGATLTGVFTLTAEATDDGEVAGVQFQVDGSDVGTEVPTPPYSLDLDSHTLSNGPHTLGAVARDTVGNSATSDEVSVEVDNPPPQNVVVIMSDDQRADLMQYMPLTSVLLNAETVRFNRGFVTTSLCCPSRSSFLTGLYAHNHGVRRNVAPDGGATNFNPTSTIATWLQQAGYRTGLIGKYLNEYDKLSPAIPPGWDDFEVFSEMNPGYSNYRLNENGSIVQYGSGAPAYSTSLLAEKAAQFIWSTPIQQPLFLLYTPYAPHFPATAYPTDLGSYAALPNWRPPSYNEKDVSDKPAWVRALPLMTATVIANSDAFHKKQVETVQALDRAVVTILTALQLSGRWGSTLVIYTSDNGLAWGEHRLVDRKICPYEECVKVPFWIRAPGLVARADTNLVANIDLSSTIAAWAGIVPPGKVNGMNLLPLLQNPAFPWRSALLIEHWGSGALARNSFGVRTARHFYNEYDNGNKELYDLVTDPYQRFSAHKVTTNKALMASLKATLNALKIQ